MAATMAYTPYAQADTNKYAVTAIAGAGLRASPSNCVVNAGENTNILFEAIDPGIFIKTIQKDGVEIYRNDGLRLRPPFYFFRCAVGPLLKIFSLIIGSDYTQ